jgi:hypothetical protein
MQFKMPKYFSEEAKDFCNKILEKNVSHFALTYSLKRESDVDRMEQKRLNAINGSKISIGRNYMRKK